MKYSKLIQWLLISSAILSLSTLINLNKLPRKGEIPHQIEKMYFPISLDIKQTSIWPQTDLVYILGVNSHVTAMKKTDIIKTWPIKLSYDPLFKADKEEGWIYIVNTHNSVIHIISHTTVITRLKANGLAPSAIAINPNNNQAYVLTSHLLNDDGSTVHKTIGSNLTVIHQAKVVDIIPIEGRVMGQHLSIDPLTNYIYVAGYNTLVVLDGKEEIVRFDFESKINDLAINPHTGNAYLLYDSNQKLTRFNQAKQFETIETKATRWSNSFMEIHPTTSHLYICDGYEMIVVDDMTIIGQTRIGLVPKKMAIDPLTENVYVVNQRSRTLSVINGTKTVATLPIGYVAYDIVLNSTNGWIYVPSRSSHDLFIFGF